MRELNLLWQNKLSLFAVFALILSSFLIVGTASAQPYFQGKVISFVVPYSAGGGTDVLGRMLSRHLSQYIPGNPSIVIRNMPGAGGMIGSHHVYFQKSSDGKTVLLTSGSDTNANILRLKGVEYYLEKMHPIYSIPIGAVIVYKPGLIKERKDILKTKGLIFGHTGPTGSTGSAFVWAKELLGFESKEIWGYDGGGPSRMAFISGETNVSGQTTVGYNASFKPLVDRNQAVPLFQTGLLDENGNVVKEEGAPDVPTVPELYEQIYGKKPTGPVWEAYKLIVGSSTYGKTVLLPTITPPNIVKIYRDAFAKMVKDPNFLKESDLLNPGAPHFIGDKLTSGYPKGVSGPPEVIQFMRKVLSEKYNVRFD
ncbi:MAG: tripartite tricarboxylate transporter substrate-binding protein [Thermodesulfobacteriota bacterium]|nr:tripartite tricarboxylate transporter substrate-binding protein [Thermodesulfobacteriota bacterium]